MELPADIAEALEPLFDVLPLEQAMPTLVVHALTPPQDERQRALREIVESMIDHPAVRGREALASALWLYIDELDRSHTISQGIDTPTGSYWHGIMHRREGDFSNSQYWFRRTGQHPAIASMPDAYEPYAFIDAAANAYRAGNNHEADLLNLQRSEWLCLFTWCAASEAPVRRSLGESG